MLTLLTAFSSGDLAGSSPYFHSPITTSTSTCYLSSLPLLSVAAPVSGVQTPVQHLLPLPSLPPIPLYQCLPLSSAPPIPGYTCSSCFTYNITLHQLSPYLPFFLPCSPTTNINTTSPHLILPTGTVFPRASRAMTFPSTSLTALKVVLSQRVLPRCCCF